ncbi:GTPase [Massilia sp. TWR1-2-2]|uniref:GTPase n=1 Tax=Massilia sp. TWR1-2-2 TaxID=2804584 RepID=UPI003CEFF18E
MSSIPPLPRTTTTLVTGATAGARERLIAAHLPPDVPGGACRAVLLEGLPDGQTILIASSTLLIERIAPGCLCCTGNLVLRVTLNRLLRRRPERLYIGLATTEHLDQLRSWLRQPPYDQLLELTPDLHS